MFIAVMTAYSLKPLSLFSILAIVLLMRFKLIPEPLVIVDAALIGLATMYE